MTESGETFCVDASGQVHGVFPPGAHVFPVDAAEVVALDAAVREALAQRWAVTGGSVEPGPSRTEALERYLNERLPGLVAALTEQGSVVDATLARAVARVEAFEQLGAPEQVVAAARAFALEVAAGGWRPVVDLDLLLPDPAGVAAAMDDDATLAVADLSPIVLLAALCAVGPAHAVPAEDPALRWHRLGGEAPDIAHERAVGLAVYDERVERLDYALTPGGGALLAVTLPTE
ncbi:hypothetical protein AB0J72_56360 [Dactylosporangium sp. NPDC049742]|uniref:hypothetical protein n=1 Tax=Dactylosporangium sp. NPDC049742 TaxID=3154737 RepID=UPI0034274CFA